MKAKIYQTIFYWAVRQWRKTLKDDTIKRKKSKVSHHASLRYLERIEGVDFNTLNDRILTDEVKAKMSELGGSGRFTHNDVHYVFDDGFLLTVYKPDGHKKYLEQSTNGKRWVFE